MAMVACYSCLGAVAGDGDGGGGGGGQEHYRISSWKCKSTRMKIPLAGSSRKLYSFSASRRTMAIISSNNDGDYSKKRPADMVTFSSMISTEVPLYEPPGVSFNEYIEDRHRIFEAMFPDKNRSQRLNDEEWRIHMLPLRFLLASVNPVVDMRLGCKAHGNGYPSAVPIHVTRILELQSTRWELKGLEGISMPSNFDLNVQGVLYSVRRGSQSYLKGDLEISISLVLPPALALVPMDVLKAGAETVLTGLVQKMKQEVHAGLISDFSDYAKEMVAKCRQPTALPATAAIVLDADPQTQ